MAKYTTSAAFLEALQEAGVDYLFANFGSDHPAMIEALADGKRKRKKLPKVITCPHEMVALSAAHGYAQVTGKPQAVVVHVECGTQNLGAAIHNAWKGRVPVFIYAGLSPVTQEGELLGSRNEFIHWLQDVPDQRGIVRGYMKYENEIRTGANVKQLVHRAIQIAKSEPKGPVYLVGAREVMEEDAPKVDIKPSLWEPTTPKAIPSEHVTHLVNDLLQANRPLVVTSYVGRNKEAVHELVRLCETLAIPVLESVPNYMNFPSDNPMHGGYQWNTPSQNELLAEADFILVVDSDVPWIPYKNKPADDAVIYYIDEDPLKEGMPLWYIPSKRFFEANALVALKQINEEVANRSFAEKAIESRRQLVTKRHYERKEKERALEKTPEDGLTPEYVLSCVREIIDENTVVTNELISSYLASYTHLNMREPGSIFGSGAGGLGWNGGAAVGVKLADPSKTVINLTGDGCYMFSVPSTVYWLARKYDAPILTVVFNNRGWKSPKLSTLGVHPKGIAHETDEFFVDFTPHANLSKIAEAAGGAYTRRVEQPQDLKEALQEALNAVKSGRSAVLDVILPAVKEDSTDIEVPDHANI